MEERQALASFGALSQETRLQIVRMLVVAGPDGGAPVAAPVSAINWSDLVDNVERAGSIGIANTLRMQVRVIELSPGKLVYTQPPGFNEDITADLRNGLLHATGERWLVERGEAKAPRRWLNSRTRQGLPTRLPCAALRW